MDEDKKSEWVGFLGDLQYNVNDEELVVNELQAYMATERQLFAHQETSAKGGKSKSMAGSGAGSLKAVQAAFASYISPHLPDPPSIGSSTKVVWL